MRKNLVSRIERLEAASPDTIHKEAERAFWNVVAEQEIAFPPEAASMSAAERMRLTPARHFAWLRRFQGEADLDETMRLYGFGGAPGNWGGYMLAMAHICPGELSG